LQEQPKWSTLLL